MHKLSSYISDQIFGTAHFPVLGSRINLGDSGNVEGSSRHSTYCRALIVDGVNPYLPIFDEFAGFDFTPLQRKREINLV